VTDGDRALHTGLALPVLSVGLLGLLHDSSLIPLRHPGSLHALFGALLLFFVAACFCRHVRRTPRLQKKSNKRTKRDRIVMKNKKIDSILKIKGKS